MSGPLRIAYAWPVKPRALPWRSANGLTLAEELQEWLDSAAAAIVPAGNALPLIEAGAFCGLVDAAAAPTVPDVLVTQAALSACVAGMGLACSTVSELHHVLAELVDAGLVAETAERITLAGTDPLVCYRIRCGALLLAVDQEACHG